MPKPEAIWIALGIVVAALAIALGKGRRAVFFGAMRALIAAHESRERIVAFGDMPNHARAMSHSIRGGVAWLKRLLEELDDGDGR